MEPSAYFLARTYSIFRGSWDSLQTEFANAMGPTLICDKSSLQKLGAAEVNMLRRYYTLNLPPILCVEILGDLKKPNLGVGGGQGEVRWLAGKLANAHTGMNVQARDLIVAEFRGARITMDGRLVLRPGKQTTTTEGKTGVIFDPLPEEQALDRWQAGDFLAAEGLLAAVWRRVTKSLDLEGLQRQLRSAYKPRLRLQTMAEVVSHVDEMIATASPLIFISWFVRDVALGISDRWEIMERVTHSDPKTLATNFPYSIFCLKAALLFHFGLAFGLISTRETNRVDLEYLFYLPFCNAFSSGDHFHRVMVEPLLRNDQTFIWADELKGDLKQLAGWLASLTPEEQELEMERAGPPENDQSVTHRLWQRLMRPGYRTREKPPLTPELEKRLMEHIKGLMDGARIADGPASGSLDDADFMVRKRTMHLDGPCFCGSGRTLANCHWRGRGDNNTTAK